MPVVGIVFNTTNMIVNESNSSVTVCLIKNVTTAGAIYVTMATENEIGVENPADSKRIIYII